MQLGDRDFGMSVDDLVEATLEEHVARRPAELARGDHTPRQVAICDRGIDANRAHRAAAACGDETQRAHEQNLLYVTTHEAWRAVDPPVIQRGGGGAPGWSKRKGTTMPSRMRAEKSGALSAAFARASIRLDSFTTASGRLVSVTFFSYSSSFR